MTKTKKNTSELTIETPASNEAEEMPIIKDRISIDFLLKEYDRLVEYQKTTIEDYNRWFNVYVGVASASIVILVPLSQTLKTGNESLLIDIILVGLFLIGAVNFTGLSYANATNTHLERAIRLIQDCFTERDHHAGSFLYFRKYDIGVSGSGPRALIIRGLTGGSPKALLVFINSIVASILVVKVSIEFGYLKFEFWPSLLEGVAVFLTVAFFHLMMAIIVNRVNDIQKTKST